MFKVVTSIALIGCLLWQAGHAIAKLFSQIAGEAPQPEGEVIILSEVIGPEIDADERDRYGIMPGIPRFISGMIIQQQDGKYVAWVTYEEDGQTKHSVLGLPREVLDQFYAQVRMPSTEPQRSTAEIQPPESQAHARPFIAATLIIVLIGAVLFLASH